MAGWMIIGMFWWIRKRRDGKEFSIVIIGLLI